MKEYKNYPEQDILRKKAQSTPIKKSEEDNNLPENSEQLLEKLKEIINTEIKINKHSEIYPYDLKLFKDILSKCSKLLNENIKGEILKQFIEFYKHGNIYIFSLFESFLEKYKESNKIISIIELLIENINQIDDNKHMEEEKKIINNSKIKLINKLMDKMNKNNNFLDNLKNQINDYSSQININNKKLNTYITSIKNLLDESVKNCLGNESFVILYGSRSTGLCLPDSDIDFVINKENNINNYNNNLELFFLHLDKYKYVYEKIFKINDLKFIKHTKVPIIKMLMIRDNYNFSVDISMNSHQGIECINYITIKLKEYESLGPLTLALKNIFKKAKLNDPYLGGLSSYGIILLIIYFLKYKKNQGEDISKNNLGKLFFELLLFYKIKENIKKPLIINGNDIINDEFKNKSGFIIVDPLNPFNNVAKKVEDFNNSDKILGIFDVAIKSLLDTMKKYISNSNGQNINNILNNIFNAKFSE